MTESRLGELTNYASQLASRDLNAVRYAGRRLAEIITRDDWPVREAVTLTTALSTALGKAGEPGRARIALLLGILAERSPDAQREAETSLQGYLDLLAGADASSPEYLSLLYLLGHFPDGWERIMAVAACHAAADPAGISRLDRTLREPGPDDPLLADIAGRSWPSPVVLAVTDEEVNATAEVRRMLPRRQLLASAAADTGALLAYAGGRAVAGGA